MQAGVRYDMFSKRNILELDTTNKIANKIIKLSSVSFACRRLSRTKLALKMLSHPTISTSRFYLASKMNDLRLVHQPLQHKGREGARADRRYSVLIWLQRPLQIGMGWTGQNLPIDQLTMRDKSEPLDIILIFRIAAVPKPNRFSSNGIQNKIQAGVRYDKFSKRNILELDTTKQVANYHR